MIILKQIFENIAREEYLKNKLEKLIKAFPEKSQESVLQSFINPPTNCPIPHFSSVEGLPGSKEAMSAASEICNLFPMISNEYLKEEEFCILLQESSTSEESSLYLRQKTNFSEIYLEVPNRIIQRGVISIEENSELDTQKTIPVWALSLAKKLGAKLLEAGASYIWDQVKKEVLGETGLPDYYEQVYAEIRRIISYAFDEHYLKEVRDLASKFSEAMELYNNMGRLESDFLIVKSTSLDLIVKSNSLGSPGAFHYAEASILHIMTLQEGYKRLVEAGADPEQLEISKKFISEKATEFASNIVIKRNNLLTERMAKIVEAPFFYYPYSTNPNPGRVIAGIREGGYRSDGRRFEDLVGPLCNKFEDIENDFWLSMSFDWAVEIRKPCHSWKWVNNRLKKYRRRINQSTISSIEPLLEVAQHLRNLAAKPIPTQE